MMPLWSAHADTQRQVFGSQSVLRRGGLQGWASCQWPCSGGSTVVAVAFDSRHHLKFDEARVNTTP